MNQQLDPKKKVRHILRRCRGGHNQAGWMSSRARDETEISELNGGIYFHIFGIIAPN